jgi:hypothetical protein
MYWEYPKIRKGKGRYFHQNNLNKEYVFQRECRGTKINFGKWSYINFLLYIDSENDSHIPFRKQLPHIEW